MSPDFEYLLRLAVTNRIGHSAIGLVVFSIPVGFFVWLVFSRLIRPAAVELLPPGLARAMRPPVLALALGLVAVAIGALSHVMWDGITHRRGWTPAILPVLMTPVVPGLPIYRLLQHLSSAVGAIAIVMWVRGWIRRQPREARRFAPGQFRQSLSVVATILAVSAVAGLANTTRLPIRNVGDWLALFVVGGMAAFAVALLVFGIIRRRRPAEALAKADGATISACPD